MVVTNSRTAVVTLPTDTQILITRTFAAPRHLVYRAWTTRSSSGAGGAETGEKSPSPRWTCASEGGGATS